MQKNTTTKQIYRSDNSYSTIMQCNIRMKQINVNDTTKIVTDRRNNEEQQKEKKIEDKPNK